MFSATWPKEVQKLAHTYLKDFIQVTIGSLELSANLNITQIVEVCSDFEKRGKLIKHLEKISSENAKVLIFIGTKRVADDLTKYLRQDGWPALSIHGDKQQQERDWVLGEFKSGRSPIMIATGAFALFSALVAVLAVVVVVSNFKKTDSLPSFSHFADVASRGLGTFFLFSPALLNRSPSAPEGVLFEALSPSFSRRPSLSAHNSFLSPVPFDSSTPPPLQAVVLKTSSRTAKRDYTDRPSSIPLSCLSASRFLSARRARSIRAEETSSSISAVCSSPFVSRLSQRRTPPSSSPTLPLLLELPF